MLVLNTLIVEDEGLSRRRMERMVNEHSNLQLIPHSAKSGLDALEKIKLYQPDLILLDIELKDFNAFEILNKIENFQSKIIFITAFSEYAIKAFEVEAIDYLLKPFTIDRFNTAVQKVITSDQNFDLEEIKKFINKKSEQNHQKLVIPEGNTQHFIDGTNIEYIYSQGYYVNLVMNNQKKLIRISLKLLEEILPDNFHRINKSTIINSENINQLVKNKTSLKIIMKDRNEFFVTDKYKEQIEESFNF